eukprot:c10566_g1_i1.p1 GENE.c10566_g1_i1~~c10566_g1_i1.p1  ORF type:complete len:590 (+),score=163.03 c10566_g1_i1:55-1770(+)
MRDFTLWGLLSLAIICVNAKDHLWGVHTDEHPFYQTAFDKGQFTCKDSTSSFPASHVNDDYCDCEDGSDEPGTSACLAARFFCANKGFKPLTVYSSRVNDGVCDCCDGSDEWHSSAKCADTCHVDGQQYRTELKQRFIQMKEAVTRREALLTEAVGVKQFKEQELAILIEQAQAAEVDVTAKTTIKEEKEKEEERVRAEKKAEWDLLEEARIAQVQQELEAKKLQEAQAGEGSGVADAGAASSDTVTVGVSVDGASVELPSTLDQKDIIDPDDDDDDEEVLTNTNFDMNDFPNGQPVASCIGWFQTGACDPKGVREPDNDRSCSEWVPKGSSGYCQCANDVRHEYTCEHKRLRCEDVCVTLPHHQGKVSEGKAAARDAAVKTARAKLEAAKAARATAAAATKADATGADATKAVESEVENQVNEDLAAFDDASLASDEEGDSQAPAQPEPTVDPLAKREMPSYSDEEAEAARKALDEAKTEKSSVDARLTKLKKDLSAYYGENDAFLPLKDKCALITLNKYKYELCMYGVAKQHDGHSDIRLGYDADHICCFNSQAKKFKCVYLVCGCVCV